MSKSMEVIKDRDGLFAVMETSKGDIVLELYYRDTPLTVTSFTGLAEGKLNAAKGKPFYDGLKFHRVIDNFMVQGGDPLGTGTGGPGYRFADEVDTPYTFSGPGILAMANAGPGTNGSQFFITHVETPWLQGKHTIFGAVIAGQNVVNSIRQNDIIKKLTIVRNGEDAKKFQNTQADFDRLNAEVTAKAKAAADKARAETAKMLETKFTGFTRHENGIYYLITGEGKGEKIGKGKNVTVKYKGYLLDDTVFDNSDFHEPLKFTVGIGQMIPGFDMMVQDMKPGEKRTMVLPPELAYGSAGAGGVIPPNAHIVFDVEVINVK